jgi:hypothetical protein
MPPDHNDAIEIALLRQDVEMLKVTIDKQSKQIEDLLSAWNAASTLVSFIKLLGGIAIAIGAVVAFVKGYQK